MSGQLTKCPGCGLYVTSKGDFCPYCGSRLDPNIIVCPNCLKENPKGSKTCSSCGAYLNPSYPGQDPHEGAGRQKKERKRRLSQSQKREQRAEERAGRKQTRAKRSEDQDAGREEERRKTQDQEEQKKRTRKEQLFSEVLEEYLRMRLEKERQSGTDEERGNRQIYSEGKAAGTGTAQGRKWNPYKTVIVVILILCLIPKPIANIVKTVMRNDTSETDSADTGGTESSSAGWRSFYRNAEIIETDDGSYSLVEADSSEIDFEDLEDWYSNYVAGTDADWFVILYTDQENSGVYAVDGLVQTGVTLEESSEGVYTLVWTEDDTMYVPSYDYSSDDSSLVEVEESGEGAEGTYDSVTWEMSLALGRAIDRMDGDVYSRSKLIYYLEEMDGCSAEEAEYAADNCGADWEAMALQQAEDSLSSRAYSYDSLIYLLVENYDYTDQEAEYAADNCGADWDEQALLDAEEVLGYGYGYSYAGLIEILTENDGFTEEQAEYAADNCGADWNEQALQAAEDRLESNSGYSYTFLVERLTEGDGFTEQEAAYGADHCGADWNEQAVMAAEDYLDIDSIDWDREKLIRWLTEYDYFTETQAEYAADQVGM